MPKKMFLQGILLHHFIQKKSPAEAHKILVENYSDYALLESTCWYWFRLLKNNHFDVEDKECFGTPKKFQDKELEVLLHEDSCQVQVELADSLGVVDHTTVSKHLKTLGMIKKQGHWVLYK